MRLANILRSILKQHKKYDLKPGYDYSSYVSGLTWKEFKHHYAIIPIHLMTLFSMCMAGAYVIRLATRHPEVSWTRANPEPWNEYRAKQYKFVSSGRDYSQGSLAPVYK